jgi:hypothetical protein
MMGMIDYYLLLYVMETIILLFLLNAFKNVDGSAIFVERSAGFLSLVVSFMTAAVVNMTTSRENAQHH